MSKLTSDPVDAGSSSSPVIAEEGVRAWWAVWLALIVVALVGSALILYLRPARAAGLFMPMLAMLVCLLAAGFDTATARIPNPITYAAILFGLAINTLASLETSLGGHDSSHVLGTVGAMPALGGFALCAGIGIICLTMAGMGGGDLKLMVAMGAMLGFADVSMVLLWTLAIAVPYALVNLVARGKVNGVLRAVGSQFLQMVYLRQFGAVPPPSRSSIPLAVPMLVALFCTRAVPSAIVWHWLGR